MTYKIEVRNGHQVVDMSEDVKESPGEIILEILKYMTGYKLVELLLEVES